MGFPKSVFLNISSSFVLVMPSEEITSSSEEVNFSLPVSKLGLGKENSFKSPYS